ncbi:MAG TPA: hydrogenase expression/formation protein HypE [Candidatus Competibacteraceae bacterium]|nr:hydrogenase expression/formation protein HypE [Candidatus Competibacteraceae bacterium]HRZ05348.1 hydrogenase expression/formation protein HypE [Candidatus Competibacteraceae bacterium]HSA45160.1 hydrogenase expression/formation protein HypE [Candidatus Competibacteraceae bacterium]
MNQDKPRIDAHVTLAHGNGGRRMRELIDGIFAREFGNPLDTQVDAARLPLDAPGADWLITTDGFTVEPLEFPGGDIGSLAVYGTVNDLAVSGATPRYLSLNMFIEEGLEMAVLERISRSIARACQICGICILAGDTKVVRRGQGGGLYLATTGIGQRRRGIELSIRCIQPGDRLIVSGTVGDHGTAVMLAREQFGLSGNLRSDAMSVAPITEALLECAGLRFMRDPTRGGIATVAHDIASATAATVRLFEDQVPVRNEVRGVCEILGYDPYYLASEGRVVAVLNPKAAESAVVALQRLGFHDARVIGVIESGTPRVILQTRLGGERLLPELEDDPLPRIC